MDKDDDIDTNSDAHSNDADDTKSGSYYKCDAAVSDSKTDNPLHLTGQHCEAEWIQWRTVCWAVHQLLLEPSQHRQNWQQQPCAIK